jgi:tetratricopeptide (TPR) repeat protein
MPGLTPMRRTLLAVALWSLTVPALVAHAQGAPAGASASEAAARGEAIRRYETLLDSNSPALAGSREEMMFRLGLLYLEDAQAAGPQTSYSRSRCAQALSLLEQVLSRGGSFFREEALYYHAIALEETGRADLALADFRTLIREFPASSRASEVWFRLGNDAVQKNQLAEAASDYQEVLRRGDPRYRDQSSYMYAWTAFALRQPANARLTLVDLLQRLESSGQQKASLYAESVELLAKVLRSESSVAPLAGPWMGPKPAFVPLVLRRTADLFRETSGFREAAAAYETLIRDFSDPAEADELDALVIECYSKAGDAPRAEEARERLIARHASGSRIPNDRVAAILPVVKESALYLHQRARETRQPDAYRRAIAAYQIFLESSAPSPGHWDMAFLQADAMKDAGDWASASKRYQEIAAARDPAHGEESAFRRIALTEEAKARGLADVATVLATYEDYFKLYPGGAHEVELRVRQAGYLFDQKRYADALIPGGAVVSRIVDAPARQKLELLLARSAFQAGDYNQSVNWVSRLLAEAGLPPATRTEAEGVHAAAILKAAESLKDRPLDAASQYEMLARAYPRHPSAPAALYNAAVLCRDNGDKARALALFRKLIEDYPRTDLARDATAAADDIYKKSGDASGAAMFLAQAAATGDDPNLLYEAAARARAGNYTAQASDLYDRFLRTRPPNDLRAASARIFLAQQYGRQGRGAEAERLARETIANVTLTGTPEQIQQAQLVLAQARLVLGEAALGRFDAIRISDAGTLKRKQQAMEAALEELRAAAAYGFAEVSLASYYKIGYAQLEFSTAVMQAPRPKTLSAEQRDQYDSLLAAQMKPYREGAEKAFRITLDQARSAGVENEWTARARSSLVEFGAPARPAS